MTPLAQGRVLGFVDGGVIVQRPGGVLQVVAHIGRGRCHAGDLIAWTDDEVFSLKRHPDGVFPPEDSSDTGLLEPEKWARLKQRASLLAAIREFFGARAFLEVETPLIVDSPGTEVHLAPVPVTHQSAPNVAPSRRYLITSPEYHMKRLVTYGAPQIFQLCKVFRDAERGRHHRSEFTMLEWYRPYATLDTIMEDCEALLLALVPNGKLSYQGLDLDLTPPFPRFAFYDLLRERADVTEPERLSHDEALKAFVDHVEQTLGFSQPCFVVDYPASMASLARTKVGAPQLAARTELYAAGLELANGFDELTDPQEQRRRCIEDNQQRVTLGLPSLPLDEEFLDALSQGMPRTAGIALGVDRLVMLMTDADRIDDVVAF